MKLKLCTALLTAATILAPLAAVAEKAQNPADAKRAAVAVYGKLPLSFEPTESPARFVAHRGGYTVAVGARESSVVVAAGAPDKGQTLHFAFENANAAARLEALDPLPGVTNYYLGQDPGKWRLGVKNYAKLRAQGLYPGVDVIYYGDHRRMEFDFVVAPKADPSVIGLSFSGMEKLYKDASGDLVAEVGGQPVRFAKPYAYQKVEGVSRPVEAAYELAAGRVHFRLGAYDSNAELIIDPVVAYATYLGGSATDVGNGIAVDSTGAAYVTGQTCSTNFASESLTFNGSFSGSCNAYVTKFSADGRAFAYTTFIGGTSPSNAYAVGNGIALDANTQAYIVGTTNFTNLPNPDGTTVYTNTLNTWQGGDSDAFIAILSPSGALARLSYLGGLDADFGWGIAVDTSDPVHVNNVVVVGETCGIHEEAFPRYNGFETKVEFCAAFITKLDNALHIGIAPGNGASALSPLTPRGTPPYYFSEFYAGLSVPPLPTAAWHNNTPYAEGAIVLDNDATPNVQIAQNPGTSNNSGLPPLWNTQVKGLTYDGDIVWENVGKQAAFPNRTTEAYGVAFDPLGDVFVAGGTTTEDLGTSAVPYGPYSYYHGSGAWVLKVNGGQTTGQPGAFVYGTALEKNTADSSGTIDVARAIAVDTHGYAYVTGTATGSVLTTANSYQPAISKGQDAFLVKMDIGGGAIPYATYLGGSGDDQGLGVAVDTSGAAYVTGSTKSTDFPTINPLTFSSGTPLQTVSGGQDAFITKFSADGSALVFSAYLGGSDLDQGNAIAVAVDPVNQDYVNMYVAGNTSSTDLNELNPTTYTPPEANSKGNGDAFVAKVAGSSLPIVSISPGTLNFPAQDVNVSSAPQAVTYTNPNLISAVTISNIATTGDFSIFDKAGSIPANCTTGQIQPGLSCDIWVVFTPSDKGSRTGTLTITDTANTTSHVIDLSGLGTVPQDAFSAPNLAFSDQGVNTTSATPQILTLTNNGTGTLYISGITITGANQGDFSQTSTCGPQLAASNSCAISVTFTPVGAGKRAGSLVITDNAPNTPHTTELSGTGVLVASTISTLGLNFPQQAINVASTAKTVTIDNVDPSQTLIVGAVSITGDYQLTNNCTSPVPPSGSCSILVAFDPTQSGTRTGSLTINGTGIVSGNPMPVTVALTGTAGATATLSPSVTFAAPNNVGVTSPAQSVTLANQSGFAFNVQSIVISGAAASEFSQTNNCGTSVSANSSCTILVSFKPAATGNRNATLTVTSDAAASPQSVSILGIGTAPTVTLSPTTNLTFPNQPLNAASSALSITLTNTLSRTTGPLNIPAGGITITGTAASDFNQTNTCGTQVAAGASCVISVVFTPSALYSRSATLAITDDAVPNPQTIALLGAGVQVKTPTITPPSLTFANQPLNAASAVQNATVTNTDPAYTLSLNSAVASGDFQIVTQAGSCGASLAPNSSCIIGVTFTPTASGTRTGTLTVSSNGSSAPLTVQLMGTGGAVAAVSPTSLDLGNTNVGQNSAAKTVTLTNSSAFQVNITGVTMSGASATQFVASNNCGTVLPASGACTVGVVFKPTATGIQTASMTIASDAATPFAPVSLTGTGTTPVVSLSTLALSFPDQALNVASSSLPITLSNTGSGALNFSSSIAISGAAAGDFKQSNNCGLQLLAGASCVINVTFTPSALNSRIASLVFADDAANSPQSVTLSGNGIAGSGVIQLAPATVAFGSQQVNTTSSNQTVTLTNASSTAPLNLGSVSLTGTHASDFSGVSNCPTSPTSLAAGASCQIVLNFTPSVAAVESATLTVTGSASNSPQSVTLTGTGTTAATGTTPFTVTPVATGVSITQGGTAVYSLSVAPLNGFNSSIAFTCSGPSGSSCSVSPNPLTMDGTTVPTVKVYVNTNGGNGVTANVRFGARSIFLALLPFSMMGMLLINKRRGYWLALMLVTICLLLGLAGCGAGAESASSIPLAPGTYQVSVVATSGATTQNITLSLVVNKQ